MGYVVIEGENNIKGKENEKRKGDKGKKEKKRKKRDRRRKGERNKRKSAFSSSTRLRSDGWNSSDQEVKYGYSMRAMLQEAGILPILVYFYLLGYYFGLILGPRCAMLWHRTGL